MAEIVKKEKSETQKKKRKVDLKKLRAEKRLTQQEVADRAGISRSYYGLLEIDTLERKHTPAVHIIEELAAVLGFKWSEFYEDEDADE